jgi:cytochrome c
MNFKSSGVLIALLYSLFLCSCGTNEKRILVFSKTTGFRHESIKEGKLALMKLGQENGIKVDTTENSAYMTEDSLKHYSAVVFLNTTGWNLLNPQEQIEFERYIQAGGGYMGIHAASDTEYGWQWYVKLVGGNFQGHPGPQKATIHVLDKSHPATKDLPNDWIRTDEWYNFKSLNPDVTVLATLDEKTYEGGNHGDNHPLIWYHEYDGGRVFYTECGHTKESFSEPLYLKHLLGGIQYAIGTSKLDFSKAKTKRMPEESRFTKQVIIDGLNEPMALAVAEDGRMFFIELNGEVFCHFPKSGITKQIGMISVDTYEGFGVMGMTLDPDFTYNSIMYLYYTDLNDMCFVSAFKIKEGMLDQQSEKKIISFQLEHEPSAHNGGTIAFDSKGNLIISTGDNIPPWQANGYPPLDERPERKLYDSQKSASNTNDLRGKILRIKPNPFAGKYTIPEGNLFPKDGSKGLPEIYAMGCRNPWRLAVDKRTDYIYWGEVGPDAGKDSTIGPRGYDEINQARKPGNFGWPYFVGDNKPYKKVDFVTGAVLEDFQNPEKPVNNSPNNTGSKFLPRAQKALIWYPYAESQEFPDLGKGGRTTCMGPFYYYSDYKNSTVKFPNYYDGKFLMFDWVRDKMWAVTLDKDQNFKSLEPMLPNMRLDHPCFMAFGPDGALYVIEYGYIWHGRDESTKISKITYHEGNRPPVIRALTSDTNGHHPLTVKFDASKSLDLDGDPITYEWTFDGNKIDSKEAMAQYTFTSPGIYRPLLTVRDSKGGVSTSRLKVIVGNTYPKVDIQIQSGNESFYWPGRPIQYKVLAEDKEDGTAKDTEVKVVSDYLSEGKDNFPQPQMGHQAAPVEKNIADNTLVAQSDCKACHAAKRKSVGPAFYEISKRYSGDPTAVETLAKKIINGGNGNWGDHAMSAHPQLSIPQAKEMVEFIFTFRDEDQGRVTTEIKREGAINLYNGGKKGSYFITAQYTDKGYEGRGLLTSTDFVKLRNSKVEGEEADSVTKTVTIQGKTAAGGKYNYVGCIVHESNLCFKKTDMSQIGSITVLLNSKFATGKIEIRLDNAIDGKLIGSIPVKATNKWEDWYAATGTISAITGKKNVYLVFKCDTHNAEGEKAMINLDWVQFNLSDKKIISLK